jgi:bifunctional lysine-specific demethylase and histidyl-hydroxylase NO66
VRTARVSGAAYEVADPGKVVDQFAAGATVVLQALHRWWPPLARFCRELELALTHPVQANAYLTPAGASGLTPHHDTHDVLVLQVAGTKTWRVRRPVVVDPLPRHRSDHELAGAQPLLFEADMAPGDALYLPRGFVHSATAQEGASLHLTLGILAVTVADAVHALVDEALEDPAFRANLPAGALADAGSAAEAVADVPARLAAWLGGADPAGAGEVLARRFWNGRRPLLDGHLLQVAGLADLSDTAVVRRRPLAPCRVAVDGTEAVVALGDRDVHLPAAVAPAVERLAAGGPVAVADLGDVLDAASRLVLVRRLVREGLLEVVDG